MSCFDFIDLKKLQCSDYIDFGEMIIAYFEDTYDLIGEARAKSLDK